MKWISLLIILLIMSCDDIDDMITITDPSSDIYAPEITISYPLNGSIIDSLETIVAVASDAGGEIFKTSFYIDGYHVFDDFEYPYEFEFDICAYNNSLNEYSNSTRVMYDTFGSEVVTKLDFENGLTTSILALSTDSNGNQGQSDLIYLRVDESVGYDCYDICMGDVPDFDSDNICDDVDDCVSLDLTPFSCGDEFGNANTCPDEYSCNNYGDGTYFINYSVGFTHKAYLIDECSNVFQLYDDFVQQGSYQYYLNNQDFETGFYQFILLGEDQNPDNIQTGSNYDTPYPRLVENWEFNWEYLNAEYAAGDYHLESTNMEYDHVLNIYICNLASDPIIGCTENIACNYNPEAVYNNMSCWYPDDGCACSDGENANYHPWQDSSCYNPEEDDSTKK